MDPYDAPLSARKNTPSIFRTSIGPTPQKDGWVLGLFDFLSPESDKTDTPSKHRGRTSLASIHGNSLETPSKKRAQDDDEEVNTPRSKRVKPSPPTKSFTPSAARRTTTALTPSSHRQLIGLDDTPAFLKRYHTSVHPLNDDAGDPISWSPEINVRMRTRPALKGLSQLVRGLREMADKELDDEMDLLREVEGEGGAPKKSNFAAKLKAATAKKMDQDLKTSSSVPTLVQDSQTTQPEQQQPPRFPKLLPSSESIEMPLGRDRALDDESEEDFHPPQRGRDGKPLRVFQKRGQKRSTRMSKMRPSKAKWKPEPAWKVDSSDEAEKGKDGGIEEEKGVVVEVQVVEETQLPLPAPAVNADGDEGDDDDDDDMLKTDNEEFINSCPSSAVASASPSDEDGDSLLPKSTPKKPKSNTRRRVINNNKNNALNLPATTTTTTKIVTTSSSTQPPNKKIEPKKKKNKKKIGPTANANFRALKIRGKGSMGGKGGKKFSKSRGRR